MGFRVAPSTTLLLYKRKMHYFNRAPPVISLLSIGFRVYHVYSNSSLHYYNLISHTYLLRHYMDIYNVSNNDNKHTMNYTIKYETNLEVARQCGILLTNIKQLNKLSTLYTY